MQNNLAPWRIENFKSIKSAELNLTPGIITLLTGVNSSGKSSLIQSLLLLAQSIHSQSELVLNGPLVRLGESSSLVREGIEAQSVEISLGIEATTVEERQLGRQLIASFDLAPSEDQSVMSVSRLTIAAGASDSAPLVIGRQNSRKSDVELAMSATARIGPRSALHLKSGLDSDRRQLRTYVIMQGLRPTAIVKLMDQSDLGQQYRNLIREYLNPDSPESKDMAIRPRISLSGAIREFVSLFKREAPNHDVEIQQLASEFKVAFYRDARSFELRWRRLTLDQQNTLIDLATTARKREAFCIVPLRFSNWRLSTPTGLMEAQLIERLGSTYEALNSLSLSLTDIADRVQYLGPLRDAPRVVWNLWNELAKGLPVGTRGEYSAAVLSRSGDSPVTYTPPGAETTTKALSFAVDEWLTYLGIGETVSARSHGKLGVGLELSVNGRLRDLTSVGVGVSQALPIVVGLLSAPLESIFLIEQPELHLHPAAQGRLADFILTARPDLTIVLETHSEALLTRIRRRAAEGKAALDKIDIVFVEPEVDGSTTRKLALTSFGDLSEWPAGFLSGSQEDTKAILLAGIQRSGGKKQ